MTMLFPLTALCIFALVSVREFRLGANFRQAVAGEVTWATPRLRSVTWNGGEGGKKLGDK
jgi:hypothetical protein